MPRSLLHSIIHSGCANLTQTARLCQLLKGGILAKQPRMHPSSGCRKREKLRGTKLRSFWHGVALCQESLGSCEGRRQEPILLQPPAPPALPPLPHAPRFPAGSQIFMQKALPLSTKPHNSHQEHPAADTPTDETSRSGEQGGRGGKKEGKE